jgi:hypothetical protein
MITSWAQTPIDIRLVEKISSLSNGNLDYWSFRKGAQRGGVHRLIQYPAMMIPSMQAKLLEVAREVHGNVRRVLDPFVGGGTMLTEVMEQGLDFSGYDINPLAILSCKVKAGPYIVDDLREIIDDLLARIDADQGRYFAVTFPGQTKWFTKGATIGLSRIHRAIQYQDDLWIRRFSWLAMAETIRRHSNSRTSTYKLHIKPESEIDATAADVIQTFSEVIIANVQRVLDQQQLFIKNLVLEQGRYRGQVEISFQDATSVDASRTLGRFDLLFTSPPYGDNATTIPYGQFSFLALNWIPFADIDAAFPIDINRNTHAIDSASMGGSLRKTKNKGEELAAKSEVFKNFYHSVGESNSSYGKRLTSFCFDLRKCVKSLANLMEPGGYMVWTLGNRSLSGKRVPLDQIVCDFLEEHNIRRVAQFIRPIPSKRMPTRNSSSDTMGSEIVLIAGA